MVKPLRIVQLKIAEFSQDGQGQGIWSPEEGLAQAVEVPFSMPGDEVQVCLLKKRGKIYARDPIEWLHLSENRIIPRCKHFGHCGGCRWQHMPYQEQLKQKEAWIQRSLQPFLEPDTVWHPIISCHPPWQYRNKMELTFASDREGHRYLGLILYRTRGRVFQIEECYLTHEWIIEAVNAVSRWWATFGLEAYDAPRNSGSLRTLTLRQGERTGDRLVMLTVSGNPLYALNQKHIHTFVSSLREAIEPSLPEQRLSIFLRIQQIAKGRPTQFYEMLLYGPDHLREILYIETGQNGRDSLNFRISPSAFFQPNTRQAEQIYCRAIQLTQPFKAEIVYDLYCGMGALGICMAKRAKEVIGIELSPESALDARENAKYNDLSNISIRTGDVGKVLPLLLEDNKLRPDIVMVDPPRAGLDFEALQHLLRSKAPLMVYISCNPTTQAANLDSLVKGGYRVRAVQPVDQFPQTIHVENIVLLAL